MFPFLSRRPTQPTYRSPRALEPTETRSRSAIVMAVIVLSATVAGCANSAPTEIKEWPTVIDSPSADLPPDSRLVSPDDIPTSDADEQAPIGSIRPDNREPKERVKEIHKRGRLIVGIAQSLNRLGYRDPVNGELVGFEIDLAREIARDIFNDPDKVEFRYVESRNREKALRDREVDIIVRTMSITKTRQESIEFSAPYLTVQPRLLVPKTSNIERMEDLKDKTVCATNDSTSASALHNYELSKVLATRTWTDCLMALQRHQADAVYTDDAILSGLQAQDPYMRLVGGDDQVNHYGVGIPLQVDGKPSTGLTMQVNDTMERIRQDGTWVRLFDKWMRDYLGPASMPPSSYRTDEEARELARTRDEAEKQRLRDEALADTTKAPETAAQTSSTEE
ncbi:glutamate ABC transporter substrate-binding protein [Corynebacterium auriscanis]|uniref:glutamate ABC transporter substrate-binding protein n=1 Tax=Corynebacterium auriscanis TaxID=99807 RepID=UPI0022478719|nr:glutamate ABC transporter substrate-binding protein [Corynebacterium auriscanis]MCX2163440.1 glutamate ABC transporter substrate-binding protein [Corynebacterium auriscanis]